ncbi:MAG: Ig-like domain-containing protein [Christensenellales bacterium]
MRNKMLPAVLAVLLCLLCFGATQASAEPNPDFQIDHNIPPVYFVEGPNQEIRLGDIWETNYRDPSLTYDWSVDMTAGGEYAQMQLFEKDNPFEQYIALDYIYTELSPQLPLTITGVVTLNLEGGEVTEEISVVLRDIAEFNPALYVNEISHASGGLVELNQSEFFMLYSQEILTNEGEGGRTLPEGANIGWHFAGEWYHNEVGEPEFHEGWDCLYWSRFDEVGVYPIALHADYGGQRLATGYVTIKVGEGAKLEDSVDFRRNFDGLFYVAQGYDNDRFGDLVLDGIDCYGQAIAWQFVQTKGSGVAEMTLWTDNEEWQNIRQIRLRVTNYEELSETGTSVGGTVTMQAFGETMQFEIETTLYPESAFNPEGLVDSVWYRPEGADAPVTVVNLDIEEDFVVYRDEVFTNADENHLSPEGAHIYMEVDGSLNPGAVERYEFPSEREYGVAVRFREAGVYGVRVDVHYAGQTLARWMIVTVVGGADEQLAIDSSVPSAFYVHGDQDRTELGRLIEQNYDLWGLDCEWDLDMTQGGDIAQLSLEDSNCSWEKRVMLEYDYDAITPSLPSTVKGTVTLRLQDMVTAFEIAVELRDIANFNPDLYVNEVWHVSEGLVELDQGGYFALYREDFLTNAGEDERILPEGAQVGWYFAGPEYWNEQGEPNLDPNKECLYWSKFDDAGVYPIALFVDYAGQRLATGYVMIKVGEGATLADLVDFRRNFDSLRYVYEDYRDNGFGDLSLDRIDLNGQDVAWDFDQTKGAGVAQMTLWTDDEQNHNFRHIRLEVTDYDGLSENGTSVGGTVTIQMFGETMQYAIETTLYPESAFDPSDYVNEIWREGGDTVEIGVGGYFALYREDIKTNAGEGRILPESAQVGWYFAGDDYRNEQGEPNLDPTKECLYWSRFDDAGVYLITLSVDYAGLRIATGYVKIKVGDDPKLQDRVDFWSYYDNLQYVNQDYANDSFGDLLLGRLDLTWQNVTWDFDQTAGTNVAEMSLWAPYEWDQNSRRIRLQVTNYSELSTEGNIVGGTVTVQAFGETMSYEIQTMLYPESVFDPSGYVDRVWYDGGETVSINVGEYFALYREDILTNEGEGSLILPAGAHVGWHFAGDNYWNFQGDPNLDPTKACLYWSRFDDAGVYPITLFVDYAGQRLATHFVTVKVGDNPKLEDRVDFRRYFDSLRYVHEGYCDVHFGDLSLERLDLNGQNVTWLFNQTAGAEVAEMNLSHNEWDQHLRQIQLEVTNYEGIPEEGTTVGGTVTVQAFGVAMQFAIETTLYPESAFDPSGYVNRVWRDGGDTVEIGVGGYFALYREDILTNAGENGLILPEGAHVGWYFAGDGYWNEQGDPNLDEGKECMYWSRFDDAGVYPIALFVDYAGQRLATNFVTVIVGDDPKLEDSVEFERRFDSLCYVHEGYDDDRFGDLSLHRLDLNGQDVTWDLDQREGAGVARMTLWTDDERDQNSRHIRLEVTDYNGLSENGTPVGGMVSIRAFGVTMQFEIETTLYPESAFNPDLYVSKVWYQPDGAEGPVTVVHLDINQDFILYRDELHTNADEVRILPEGANIYTEVDGSLNPDGVEFFDFESEREFEQAVRFRDSGVYGVRINVHYAGKGLARWMIVVVVGDAEEKLVFDNRVPPVFYVDGKESKVELGLLTELSFDLWEHDRAWSIETTEGADIAQLSLAHAYWNWEKRVMLEYDYDAIAQSLPATIRGVVRLRLQDMITEVPIEVELRDIETFDPDLYVNSIRYDGIDIVELNEGGYFALYAEDIQTNEGEDGRIFPEGATIGWYFAGEPYENCVGNPNLDEGKECLYWSRFDEAGAYPIALYVEYAGQRLATGYVTIMVGAGEPSAFEIDAHKFAGAEYYAFEDKPEIGVRGVGVAGLHCEKDAVAWRFEQTEGLDTAQFYIGESEYEWAALGIRLKDYDAIAEEGSYIGGTLRASFYGINLETPVRVKLLPGNQFDENAYINKLWFRPEGEQEPIKIVSFPPGSVFALRRSDYATNVGEDGRILPEAAELRWGGDWSGVEHYDCLDEELGRFLFLNSGVYPLGMDVFYRGVTLAKTMVFLVVQEDGAFPHFFNVRADMDTLLYAAEGDTDFELGSAVAYAPSERLARDLTGEDCTWFVEQNECTDVATVVITETTDPDKPFFEAAVSLENIAYANIPDDADGVDIPFTVKAMILGKEETFAASVRLVRDAYFDPENTFVRSMWYAPEGERIDTVHLTANQDKALNAEETVAYGEGTVPEGARFDYACYTRIDGGISPEGILHFSEDGYALIRVGLRYGGRELAHFYLNAIVGNLPPEPFDIRSWGSGPIVVAQNVAATRCGVGAEIDIPDGAPLTWAAVQQNGTDAVRVTIGLPENPEAGKAQTECIVHPVDVSLIPPTGIDVELRVTASLFDVSEEYDLTLHFNRTVCDEHQFEWRYDDDQHWRICVVCNEKVDVAQHDYTDIVTPPKCTEGGYTTHTCTICGHSYTDTELPPTGHTPGDWEYDGNEHWRVCAVCGEHIGTEAHAFTHTVTPPKCTEGGYTTHTCTICGYSYTDTEVPATGHTTGDWVYDENEHWHVCSVCHDRVDIAPHAFIDTVKDATCTEGGYTTRTCECGYSYRANETEPLGHLFGEWVVVTYPTKTKVGTAKHTCERCGEEETKDIPIPTAVNLPESSITLGVGLTYEIVPDLEPEDSATTYTYSTSNRRVATVDGNGVVEAKKVGTARITVKTATGKSARLTVKVVAAPTKIEIVLAHDVLGVGETCAFEIVTTPAGAYNDCAFAAAPEGIIALDAANRTVTALNTGTAIVTATSAAYEELEAATAEVTVKTMADYIEADAETIELSVKDKALIEYELPEDTAGIVTFASDDPKIATVDEGGTVTARAVGEATITLTVGEASDTVLVRVFAAPRRVVLNPRKVTLGVGDTAKLTATLSPETAKSDITFTSSKPTVAEVAADGTVTAVGTGKANITARAYNGRRATCTVTVRRQADSVILTVKETNLLVGDTTKVSTSIPKNTAANILITSSNADVATVENGLLTALGAGETEIKAVTDQGVESAVVTVTVKNRATHVAFAGFEEGEVYTMNVGDKKMFDVEYGEGEDDRPVFTSNARRILSVGKDGRVTAKRAGEAILTVTTLEGHTDTLAVKVINAPRSVKLGAKKATLGVGEISTYTCSVLPADANQALTAESSDETIAEVALSDDCTSFTVTAKAEGKAKITLRSPINNKKATFTVTVRKAPIEGAVQLSANQKRVAIGRTTQLTVKYTSGYAGGVTWASENEAIATVSDTGLVRGIAEGDTFVTATTYNGIELRCDVQVHLRGKNAFGEDVTLPEAILNDGATLEPSDIAAMDASGALEFAEDWDGEGEITVHFGDATAKIAFARYSIRSVETDGELTMRLTDGENWKSKDKAVATVDNGILTVTGSGMAKITAENGAFTVIANLSGEEPAPVEKPTEEPDEEPTEEPFEEPVEEPTAEPAEGESADNP